LYGTQDEDHVYRAKGWESHWTGQDRPRYVVQTGATIYYGGREFRSLKGAGFKANYYDVETGEEYWISGPRKDGSDALYATNIATEIDEDVRHEYWTQIRKKAPSKSN
jgi:hypothetical protein